MVAFFAFIGALWRAWFGGGLTINPIWDCTRAIKYLCLMLTLAAMYYLLGYATFWTDIMFWCVGIAFCIHWAWGHGDYYITPSTEKDEARIKLIDWMLRKIYGEGGYYNVKGNVTGMFIRYTLTAIPVAVCAKNPLFLLAGAYTAFAYWFMWKLFPTRWFTKYGEFAAGAGNFALLYWSLKWKLF